MSAGSQQKAKEGESKGRAIIAEFNQRRQRLADTARKLEELVNEVQVRMGFRRPGIFPVGCGMIMCMLYADGGVACMRWPV